MHRDDKGPLTWCSVSLGEQLPFIYIQPQNNVPGEAWTAIELYFPHRKYYYHEVIYNISSSVRSKEKWRS